MQEVNFSMLDSRDGGGVLSSLEALLAHVMVPALKPEQVLQLYHPNKRGSDHDGDGDDDADDACDVQTWGSVQEGASCPHVQSFLSSVDQFVSNLSSARLNMERKFQLAPVELPDAISRLSSPADYRAAGRRLAQSSRL